MRNILFTNQRCVGYQEDCMKRRALSKHSSESAIFPHYSQFSLCFLLRLFQAKVSAIKRFPVFGT